MYLGYQNGKITFIADTKEELDNLPLVSFDKIVKSKTNYILVNGEYVK